MTRSIPVAARARYAVQILERDPTESVASAAEEVGVSASTVLKYWRRPHVATPRGRRQRPMAILCSVVLEHVGRVERTFGEIWDAVRQDYGEIGERRMHRALRRLVDSGLVVRHPRTGLPATYTRADGRSSDVAALEMEAM